MASVFQGISRVLTRTKIIQQSDITFYLPRIVNDASYNLHGLKWVPYGLSAAAWLTYPVWQPETKHRWFGWAGVPKPVEA